MFSMFNMCRYLNVQHLSIKVLCRYRCLVCLTCDNRKVELRTTETVFGIDGGKKKLLVTLSVVEEEIVSTPVSYTHLTLPTIYSV